MQTARLVTVDLSDQRVSVTSGGRPVMAAQVAIGAASSPDAGRSGRASVVQRMRVTPSSGYSRREYGPVIVALRLWQPIPSPANPAGGIVAFHGGDGTMVGGAVSGGCLRMRDDDLEQLAEIVRVGTPVIIHRWPARVQRSPAYCRSRVIWISLSPGGDSEVLDPREGCCPRNPIARCAIVAAPYPGFPHELSIDP